MSLPLSVVRRQGGSSAPRRDGHPEELLPVDDQVDGGDTLARDGEAESAESISARGPLAPAAE
jgi:hypothetical protein